MLGTIIGAAMFGIGMVLYGYCPGTGVAAMATGSLHAIIGGIGMLIGAMLYAFSFDWVRDNILSIGKLGKVTLTDLTGIPSILIYIMLIAIAAGLFRWVESKRL
jgi:uncharacterized membrane protein YedE/YeeE